MFFTIERNGSPYPLVAPIGVAAYCVVEDEQFNSENRATGHTRFMVAMLYMSDKEVDGYDTMKRAKKTWPNFKWQYVAMNPGFQHMHDAECAGELHGWYFRDEGGKVVAEEDAVNQFLTPMTVNQIQSSVVKGKLIIAQPGLTEPTEKTKVLT
jgi:hypothetical protein